MFGDRSSDLGKAVTCAVAPLARSLCVERIVDLDYLVPLIACRTHIETDEFRNINWLPTKERFEQCMCQYIQIFQ